MSDKPIWKKIVEKNLLIFGKWANHLGVAIIDQYLDGVLLGSFWENDVIFHKRFFFDQLAYGCHDNFMRPNLRPVRTMQGQI